MRHTVWKEVCVRPAALRPYPNFSGRRPVALRPTLSSGLPFSDGNPNVRRQKTYFIRNSYCPNGIMAKSLCLLNFYSSVVSSNTLLFITRYR
jgi:hypothetical protein